MQWLTYSPIPTAIRQFYGISTTQLNMFSTIYMKVYIALSVVSCLGLERIGLRWCLLIGTGLNFLGSMLKLVIGFPTDSFAVLMFAQVLNALSQIFVLSVPPTLALIWFKESDRGTATTIGAAANAFGCAMGMLIPPLWVSEETDLSILSVGVVGNRDGLIAHGLARLFGFQFALCGAALLGAIFLVPSTTMVAGRTQTHHADYDAAGGDGEGQMRAVDHHQHQDHVDNPNGDEANANDVGGTTPNVAVVPSEHDGVVVRVLSPPSPTISQRSPTPVNLSEASENPLVAPSLTASPTPSHLSGGGGVGAMVAIYSPLTDQLPSPPPPAAAADLYSPRNVAPVVAPAMGVGNDSTPPIIVVTVAAAVDVDRPAAPLPLDPSSSSSSAPATRSNSSSNNTNITSWLGVLSALFGLARDRDNVLCVLGLSISIGSVWAVNSLLAQLLAPINISEEDAGQMGFWNIIAGTIVAIFVGPIVDRFRVYKWPIVGLAVVNLVCLSLMMMFIRLDGDVSDVATGGGGDAGASSNITFGIGGASNPTGYNTTNTTSNSNSSNSPYSLAAIYTLNVIAGIPQNVITPIGFEFLMELSYGHPSSISGGLLMAIANAVSLVEVSIGAALLGDEPTAPKHNALNAFRLVWALLVVGLVLLVLPRNNLKRLAAQQQQQLHQRNHANEIP